MSRLFDLKLERITEAVEFGFGFEALARRHHRRADGADAGRPCSRG